MQKTGLFASRFARRVLSFALRYTGWAPRLLVWLFRIIESSRSLHYASPKVTRANPVFVAMIGSRGVLRYAVAQWAQVLGVIGVVAIVPDRDQYWRPILPAQWQAMELSDVLVQYRGHEGRRPVVLYLENSSRNLELLGRLSGWRHIFLHHGESDKIASRVKSLRVYPESAVAGFAGVERLRAAGVRSQIHVVGRPQARVPEGDGANRARNYLLYAPTYEGLSGHEDYSSLRLFSEDLVDVATKWNFELVVKFHPLAGKRRNDVRSAIEGWKRLAHERKIKMVAVDDDIRKLFPHVGLLLCDISSVACDFFPFEQPIIYTNPAQMSQCEYWDKFPTTRYAPVVGSASELNQVLQRREWEALHLSRSAVKKWTCAAFGEASLSRVLHVLEHGEPNVDCYDKS